MHILYRLRRVLAGPAVRYHYLNYGRNVILEWVKDRLRQSQTGDELRILDVGCGEGGDLLNIAGHIESGRLRLYGVECHEPYVVAARSHGIDVLPIDLERQQIPADDGFFDVVIANQVIEHTKEIFWIFAEVSRVLKHGGTLIVGVPNLAAFHNRVLLLFGEQPSAVDVLGPHVRGFTAPALRQFIEADGYFKITAVRGCNLYPFPPLISRALSRLFPTMAVTLFFLARRTAKPGNFINVLLSRDYETPYFKGERAL